MILLAIVLRIDPRWIYFLCKCMLFKEAWNKHIHIKSSLLNSFPIYIRQMCIDTQCNKQYNGHIN